MEPWCAGKRLQGLPPDSERVKSLLDVVWTLVKRSAANTGVLEVEKDLYVDVSQCISRRAWTTVGKLSSLNTSSCIFSFGMRRALAPAEFFVLLGFKAPRTGQLTNTALKSLSGEAMSLPQIGVCILALSSGLPEIFEPDSDEL